MAQEDSPTTENKKFSNLEIGLIVAMILFLFIGFIFLTSFFDIQKSFNTIYNFNKVDAVNFCGSRNYSIFDWNNCTSIGTHCWYIGNATARETRFVASNETYDFLIQNHEDSTRRINKNKTIMGLDLKEDFSNYNLTFVDRRTNQSFPDVECPIERCIGTEHTFKYVSGFLNETSLFKFDKVCCERNQTSKDCFSKIPTWKQTG